MPPLPALDQRRDEAAQPGHIERLGTKMWKLLEREWAVRPRVAQARERLAVPDLDLDRLAEAGAGGQEGCDCVRGAGGWLGGSPRRRWWRCAAV